MPHWIIISFLFALGACIGSFLNVVVWRLPRSESLVTPPSHCPKCNHLLAWRDNIPVFGWLALRGKCRYCGVGISARYPIIEAITGGLFVLFYVLFFIFNIGPCGDRPLEFALDWPMYGLFMFTISCLLAASLIDAELFIIPVEICWLLAGVGVVVHAIIDRSGAPGVLNAGPVGAALAAGGVVGLGLSIGLWLMNWIPTSFPKGEPLLEIDREQAEKEMKQAQREGKAPPQPELPPPEYTRGQIYAEIGKEILFLLPPIALALLWLVLVVNVPRLGQMWEIALTYNWFSGALGAALGALVGGLLVWVTRILGTLGFGRIAMGLGDVHLLFGVGAILGAGAITIVFFLAPFVGMLLAVYMLLTGTKRELPYGPFLSGAAALTMVLYCPIARWFAPGLEGLQLMLQDLF